MRNNYNTHRAMTPFAEYVAQVSLDGAFFDDEFAMFDGSYYGLFGRRIFIQDSQGFVEVSKFDTTADAQRAFQIEGQEALAQMDDEIIRYY